MSVPSDIDIARQASLVPINEIAARIGLTEDELIPYGRTKAKVHLDSLKRISGQPRGKYIDVTAITPTPLGEGKTTTTIGLTQGLGKIGKEAIACIRQPSMGPTFGIKGGAAGGGYSQVVPMDEFNLHLTGDIHAITAAHNLVAAAIDARWFHETRMSDEQLKAVGLERLGIDVFNLQWNRVVDINDRALRNVIVGLGGTLDGRPRETGFDITVASELMAILALVDGDNYASALRNLRERVSRVVVGNSKDKKPITLEDLGMAGATTVLMKDTLHPTVMQTLEGQAAFVHAGPFANIAHGNSSILADRIALHLADYVVTESGFGADMGMEKFMDIKCRTSSLQPDCVVLVATVRALKTHGGGPKVVLGRPLDRAYTEENLSLLSAGMDNLLAHIKNAKRFGVPVVVAINSFPTDTWAEISLIREAALAAGAADAVLAEHWLKGGDGATALAEAVVKACEEPKEFAYLYPLNMSIKQKIEIICKDIYNAGDVEYSSVAEAQIASFEKDGYGYLPICMAKTHLSISHDPAMKGAPSGYTVPVREVRASVGAGFIYPILGDMRTMPGLGSTPAYMKVDIDDDGNVVGLF
ncbi:MAG TPA: formate--tetrahydrofolate ligase [Acidimicrobiia bacterium]|nr:formate--tetrahydrofolate ligase [Acidimicrobiia bacterium]